MEEQQKKSSDTPVTPGWNDPPMLKYSAQNTPPKSRITNKRVAFPLGSSVPLPSSNEQLAKPPFHSPLPPPALPQAPLGEPCNQNLYAKASINFNYITDKIDNHDIKDQINQMLHDWQTGKFTQKVQNTLTELSSCIVDNNSTEEKDFDSRLNVLNENLIVEPYLPALRYLFTYSLNG